MNNVALQIRVLFIVHEHGGCGARGQGRHIVIKHILFGNIILYSVYNIMCFLSRNLASLKTRVFCPRRRYQIDKGTFLFWINVFKYA